MSVGYQTYGQLNLPSISEEILQQWEAISAFKKSVELREGNTPFVFYEGPPSANGMPGIHHVISRTLKDLVCRYKTMQGFQVKRKGGWDTHGLPIELGVEKLLGITKEDIGKKISVEDYNKKCREVVMQYKNKWDDITQKMGYWVDLDNPYVTFENKYIETLWWCLSQLYKKDYLYESVSIQPYSPAAGTGLSSHELNQPGTYKDVKDTSATVMFKLKTTAPPPPEGGIVNSTIKKILSNIEGSTAPSPLERAGGEVFLMAWTTTPWTLPSNLGLTVGPNIEYVLVQTFNPYTHLPINVIQAKALLHKYFKEENKSNANESLEEKIKSIQNLETKIPSSGGGGAWKILAEFKGSDLDGLKYEQLLPSEANTLEKIQELTPGAQPFKVILGDFVTTEDGTGIVHTAPAFGADDYRVGKKNNLGILTLVDRQGKFVDGVGEFSGRYVKNYKDEKDYVDVNVDISVKLKSENRAFKIEKYDHSYPHCWRTDKPIIYYPLDAWFIKTTAVKDRMVELNKTINWKPASTGTGRFGNWLENMVDWNLSRSRFWGTPMPIWKTEDGEEEICIGSIEELIAEIDKSILNDTENNLYTPELIESFHHKKNIFVGLKSLKNALLNKSEISNGIYRKDVGNIGLYYGEIGNINNNYKGGYGLSHIISKRYSEGFDGYDVALKLIESIATGKVIKEVEVKKTIHIEKNGYEAVLSKDKFGSEEIWLLTGWKINKPDDSEEFCTTTTSTHIIPTFSRDDVGAGLSDVKIRKNISTEFFFDLHKPFVDDIFLISGNGKIMKRVPDLIDVWFDSGAMPYAQWGLPDASSNEFGELSTENFWKYHTKDKNSPLFGQPEDVAFPADFIAEGVDQTRGWFYTLHALGSLLFDSVAYKTVVSNGLVLDKNGVKMSKRLGNIVDPFATINNYGADATRWYLITNASPWDSLKFDEEGIKEIQRKFFGTLYNTYQFFALYANVDRFTFNEEYIPLRKRPEIDQWILSSLNTLIKTVTENLDAYEPTQAGRAIEEFVDTLLSNWYVRLCRRRFWKGEYEHDKIAAYQTLYECLETISRLIAPIAPFFAEWLYQNLNKATNRMEHESVHHSYYPKADESVIYPALEKRMQLAQDACSLVLSLRKKVNIKVRQPLQKIFIPAQDSDMAGNIKLVEDIIKTETNIKEIEILNADNDFIRKKAKANFKTLGKRLGAKMKWAAGEIEKFDNATIEKVQKGNYLLNNNSAAKDEEEIIINAEDIDIITDEIPGYEIASKGTLTVALDITITEPLQNEGNAREFINRIQSIRKESDFELTDKIEVIVSENEALQASLIEFKDYICTEILADNLVFVPDLQEGTQIEVNDAILKVNVIKK